MLLLIKVHLQSPHPNWEKYTASSLLCNTVAAKERCVLTANEVNDDINNFNQTEVSGQTTNE